MSPLLYDSRGEPIDLRSESSSSQPCGAISGYDGAETSSARSSFLAFPTNSRKELTRATRRRLVQNVRALDANLPIVGRIIRKIATHAVGKGIFVRPLTKDKEWNELNRKRFTRRTDNPWAYSKDGSRDLYEDQRLVAETVVGDGEYFSVLARDAEGLRMQPLDVFEVESPREGIGGGRWEDGTLQDAYNRTIAYGVRELPSTAGFAAWKESAIRVVPVESMIHVFKRRRVRQPRGFTWFYSAPNDGIDALDTKALEKGTAKLHAALGLAVRKKKPDANNSSLTGQLQKLLDSDGKTTQVNENFWKGAAITYLAADEGIDLLSSSRPSPNLLAFLEFLYREIALATDLPIEVVLDLAKLGGASTRAVLEAAQWLFDLVQDLIVTRHSQRFYVVDTADAMLRGELPRCKDPDWWVAAWRGPAKLTVDLGRSADAAIKLIKNGALSHVRYHEERAQDAYEEAEEQIQYLAWLKKRCEEAGVPFELLIEPTPGVQTNISVTGGEGRE